MVCGAAEQSGGRSSVVAQRVHRIDSGGAAGRKIGGDERGGLHHRRDQQMGLRIKARVAAGKRRDEQTLIGGQLNLLKELIAAEPTPRTPPAIAIRRLFVLPQRFDRAETHA